MIDEKENIRGITLIALVITIIVLLILAGVSIATLTGENGILNQAGTARDRTKEAELEERAKLILVNWKFEKDSGKTFEEYLNENFDTVVNNGDRTYTVTLDGYQMIVNDDGEVKIENQDKVEETEKLQETDIYVTLYTDGTLAFSNRDLKIEGKTVQESYGNIRGTVYSYTDCPWKGNSSITTVNIVNEIVPTTTSYWFYDLSNLTNIENINNLLTNNTTSMYSMFEGCSSLVNIDLTGFDTSRVTNMTYMFGRCTNLTSLDLTSFSTNEMTNMSSMFFNCTKLKTVQFGNKVKNIGARTFWSCTGLENMELPESLKTIGNNAFQYCSNLKTIQGGDNVESIGDFAFDRCEKMETIHYSKKLKNIGKAAFQYCYALKNIDLPEGLETIGQFAFDHNRGLTCSKIVIPSTVKVIGHYKYPTHMFYDCGNSNFTEFEVAEGNQYYKAEDGILYTKDGSTLVSIPRGKTFENNTYIMPDTVAILGELCFNRNYNITKVIISDNLVIDDDITEEQIEAGYLNHGNSLSVGIYAYTSVRLYDVKDTNTRYTSGIKVVSRTGESGSAENQGYILTADERELVAVPSKATAWHMLTSNVTKIRKNAFYIWDKDANNNYQTTDGMYSGLVFRINQNTTDIEAEQLKYINWLAVDTNNRTKMTLKINGINNKYEVVDNQFVEKK